MREGLGGSRRAREGQRELRRERRRWKPVHWLTLMSIKRKGEEHGICDYSDSDWDRVRHSDARGGDYVKLSHAGVPPGARQSPDPNLGSAPVPPTSLRVPSLAPPFLGDGLNLALAIVWWGCDVSVSNGLPHRSTGSWIGRRRGAVELELCNHRDPEDEDQANETLLHRSRRGLSALALKGEQELRTTRKDA